MARSQMEACIAQYPQAVWPRVILSHVLLQEGIDWPAAEQALRDVVALDPSHAQARNNLAIVLRDHGDSHSQDLPPSTERTFR